MKKKYNFMHKNFKKAFENEFKIEWRFFILSATESARLPKNWAQAALNISVWVLSTSASASNFYGRTKVLTNIHTSSINPYSVYPVTRSKASKVSYNRALSKSNHETFVILHERPLAVDIATGVSAVQPAEIQSQIWCDLHGGAG